MSFLPAGILPKWLLLVSIMATANAGQNYIDHAFSRRVYTKGGASVTPLSARLFALWNLASAAIRLTCAYDMSNKGVYHLCMLSFAIALAHFLSEAFVFKTTLPSSPGIISPLIVASSSLLVMIVQYNHYLAQ